MKFFLILPVFWPKLTKIPVGGCYRINQNCHPCSTVDSLELLKSFTNFPITEIQHRSQIGSYNYLNCYMKVVYYIFTSTPGVVRFHFWTNPRTQVFWENQFFSFCGSPKNFFWPKKPFLALETPPLGGGSSLHFVQPVGEYICWGSWPIIQILKLVL